MNPRSLLFATALLLSACSKKADPAGEGTGATAPAAATPTAPTAPAPTAPAAPTAPPAAPEAGIDLKSAEKQASAWLSALGKRDAAALAAASILPFEVAAVFEYPEKCFKVKTRATTAAELEELTKCLILDRKIAKDAKLIDTPDLPKIEQAESYEVPDSPSANELQGKVRWIKITLIGEELRYFFLGTTEKGVQYVEMFEAPDEH